MTKAGNAMRAVFESHHGLAEVQGHQRPPVPAAQVSAPLASHTVTRVDLAEAVYRQVGLSRKESAGLVEMVLAEITEKLALGETVKLSSFGSFLVRDKGERVGRNPKTGRRGADHAAPRDRVQTLERAEGPHERRRRSRRRAVNGVIGALRRDFDRA